MLISGNVNPRTVTLPVGAGIPALTVNAPNTVLNTSGAPGTITFTQPLDVQSVQSFTNGAVNFVFSNPFTFAGATNFAPGSGDLTFNSNFTQTGGIFTPGTGALNFNSNFTLTGGTFNAPNGTLSLSGAISIGGTATFNPNSGTVAFVGGQNTIAAPATFTLNNVVVNKAGQALLFQSTSSIIALGTLTRSAALRSIAENNRFVNAKFNEAFVMMEYFGYLRRDLDDGGYQFWLNKLNEFHGNFEQAEMVKAFIISSEYRDRFPR